jgi:hypothetical protein
MQCMSVCNSMLDALGYALGYVVYAVCCMLYAVCCMLWAVGSKGPRGQDTHGAKDAWGQRMYRCIGAYVHRCIGV